MNYSYLMRSITKWLVGMNRSFSEVPDDNKIFELKFLSSNW